jgi:hypothetical protein
MVLWELEISSEVEIGEEGCSTMARFDMRQSKIDPNMGVFSCGYCPVKIGGSCSESPETITRPVGLRDLRTSATDPSVSCPASSMKTQSTSNDRCLLKLYNCRVGGVRYY